MKHRKAWIDLGLYGLPCHRSAHLREADENDAKADVAVGMSPVGGGADVVCQGLSGPFLAKTGHAAHRDRVC